MENQELTLVYDAGDIRKLLKISKQSTYDLLESAYKNQGPFVVLKIGKLYRIPKVPFDRWISGLA